MKNTFALLVILLGIINDTAADSPFNPTGPGGDVVVNCLNYTDNGNVCAGQDADNVDMGGTVFCKRTSGDECKILCTDKEPINTVAATGKIYCDRIDGKCTLKVIDIKYSCKPGFYKDTATASYMCQSAMNGGLFSGCKECPKFINDIPASSSNQNTGGIESCFIEADDNTKFEDNNGNEFILGNNCFYDGES